MEFGVLSGGLQIANVRLGSLPQDYALVGNAFEERWTRFDEAIQLLRSLLKKPFWRSTEG